MSSSAISHPAARTFSVVDLIAAAIEGRIRIPEFQRPLKWQWQDVQRLFDSIVKGYPIGNLLLWKRPAPATTVTLGALQISAPHFEEGWWVVDGQQRLTSLSNALSAKGAADERFALAYDLRKQVFVRPSRKEDEDGYIIPLPVLFDLQKLIRWFTKDHPEASEKLDEASLITRIIREYQVPAYLVDQNDEQVLRDIFDRMNNYGKRLSQAEVFSSLHSGRDGSSEPFSFQRIAEFIHAQQGFGVIDDGTIMRAVLARRGGNIARDIRIEFSELAREGRNFGNESPEDAYRGGAQALSLAIAFLQQDGGVPHFAFLPYRYLLVVLTRFFAHFPEPQPRNRELLCRWFWRAAMIGPSPFSSSWTIAGRTLAERIAANDENGSIGRLLESPIDSQIHAPKLTEFRTSSAQSRMVMSALWALGPRSPLTGQPYTQEQLSETIEMEGTLAGIAQRIWRSEPENQRAWAANRIIVLEPDLPRSLKELLTNREVTREGEDSDFFVSHAIGNGEIDALARDEKGVFLHARQSHLASVVKDFLEAKAGTRLEDTPPLDSFDLDDMDDERDDTIT